MLDSFFITLSTNFIPIILFGFILIIFFNLVFRTKTSYLIIIFLLFWYPLENFLFNYLPPDYFLIFKYFPEILLYLTTILAWILYIKRTGRLYPKTPLNKPLFFFILIGFISWIINFYNPVVWLLGLRQILRFVAVFWLVMLEDYNRQTIKTLLYIIGGVIGFEAILGLVQYLSGGSLDQYLFFSGAFGVAKGHLGELPQFWAPGTRVFATLGRYDQLGSFLLLGLILVLSVFYVIPKEKLKLKRLQIPFILFGGIGLLSLFFTYSRASWIGFIMAALFVGWFLMKDVKVIKIFVGVIILGALYLGTFALTYTGNVLNITDKPRSSLGERIVEIASPASLKAGYEGYGRIFFIINTPLVVVRSSPIWGVGLGNYGGDVAAYLHNTEVYDRLDLPFGIQNFYGQIDNNWFAIWGELGTVGLLLWMWIFYTVIKTSWVVAQKSKETVGLILGRAVAGITVGVMVLGFFGPYFEFRSLMFYFWLLTGLLFLYWRRHKNLANFLKI